MTTAGTPPAGDILLVAHTRLSLGYVLDHYRLLAPDPALRFTLTRAPDQYSAGVEEMMDATGLPRLPYCVAVGRPWNLALFGTHGSEIFFSRAAARVHIQHGLGAGKLVDGQDYTYGPRWALWDGKPKYTLMLEASHAVRRRAVAACPPLADRITVTGDMHADRLLAADRDRHAHRAALGITLGERAVLIASTFGPNGLLARHGLALADELLATPGTRALLTVHPHVWAGRHDHRATLAAQLEAREKRGLITCGPGQDWTPYLAAADVAVIDHSSIGLYYALLGRPALAVPVPDRAVNPAAPVAILRALSPELTRPGNLAADITAAADRFDPDRTARLRRDLLSYRGQAADRTTAALYKLLGCPAPGPQPPAAASSAVIAASPGPDRNAAAPGTAPTA